MADKKLFFDDIAHIEANERDKTMQRDFAVRLIKAGNPNISEEDLNKELRKYQSSVALMRSNDIKNVLLRDTATTIKNFQKSYAIKGMANNTDKVVNAYQKVSKNFFGYMTEINSWTAKKSSPADLMNKVIDLNRNIDKINYNYSQVKTHTDMNSIKQAYQNLKSAKSFYAFDLETLGGQNASGFKQLDTITEFSFQQFNQSGKAMKNGDYSNLIGLTSNQANAYAKEIKEAQAGGIKSGRMQVLLNRFSKYGHQDTVIRHSGKGQYIIDKFVGEGAEGLNSYENALRGVAELAKVGQAQSENRIFSGMMLWEKQWIDGLAAIRNNLTVGYNTVYADIPWINQFNASGLSAEAKKELEKRIGSTYLQLDPSKHFDYYVAANAASQVSGKAKYYMQDGQLSPVLKEHGVSPLQQEGLGRQFAGHLYHESAAHTAKVDSRVLGHFSTEAQIGNRKLIDVLMEDATKVSSAINGSAIGGERQLFLADKAVSLNSFTNENALTFIEDQFSGTIRTVGGYEIDPETGAVRKEIVKQFLIKRNMTYTIDWMKQFSTDDEWFKTIGAVHPEYAQNGLYGIKISNVDDPNVKGVGLHNGVNKKNSIYRIFTSLDEMQGFVSSTFMQIGERVDENSEWQELSGAAGAEVKKHLMTYNLKDGKVEMVPQNGSIVSRAITHSTKKGINDSAARMVRDDSYKRADQFDGLLTEVMKRAELYASWWIYSIEKLLAIAQEGTRMPSW